jgi:AraC-like DNA-binding protein
VAPLDGTNSSLLPDRRVAAALSMMKERLGYQQADLRAIAQAVNLSESRLRHLVKSATGASPNQHLKRIRLQQAAHLLETTFLSVKEIASRSGFGAPSYLVREFKKVFGVTPLQHRRDGASPGVAVGPLA